MLRSREFAVSAAISISVLVTIHLSGYTDAGLLGGLEHGLNDCADYGTEGSSPSLRQVLVIHRHGEITPIVFAPQDQLACQPFWYFNGIGQLTNEGKRQIYYLGKSIRDRYSKFLDDSVNKNLRLSRSSGSLPCIESAQLFLAGLESLELPCASDAEYLKWDDPKNHLAQIWQPINILSVPEDIDGMLSEYVCAEVEAIYQENAINGTFQETIGTEYATEIQVLQEVWGSDYSNVWNFSIAIDTLAVEAEYFGAELDPRLKEIYARVEEAAYENDLQLADSFEEQRLISGLLVDDLVKQTEGMRYEYSGCGSYDPLTATYKKLVHYVTHKSNIISLLQLLDQYDQTSSIPDFGATYLIELHQDSDWYLKFYYQQSLSEPMVELPVDQCTDDAGRCSLDTFAQVVEDYRIPNWLQWVKECGNDLEQAVIYPNQ